MGGTTGLGDIISLSGDILLDGGTGGTTSVPPGVGSNVVDMLEIPGKGNLLSATRKI